MIFKFVQLLMVLAIFNPFCCCTAEGLIADTDEQAPVTHSCCQSQSTDSNDSAPAEDSHDINECPHQALKDYQANTLKDVTALHDTLNCVPIIYSWIDIEVYTVKAPGLLNAGFATPHTGQPQALSLVYCVYRI